MSAGTSRSTGAGPTEALRDKIGQAYARHGLNEEKLILDHLPMVYHIVQKVVAHLHRKVDLDDLISAGTLGLVRAARQYDPTRGVEFSTYAYIRIRGAVIDELRGKSFVPSTAHGRIRAIQRAYEEHVAAGGGPPSDEELIQRLQVTPQQYYRTLEEARNQRFLSIHGLTEDGAALPSFLPSDGTPPPDEELERKELVERLAQAIRKLPEKERLIVLLYYERDLTMKEAAKVLKVTESRVSQLHASALFKLSMQMRNLR